MPGFIQNPPAAPPSTLTGLPLILWMPRTSSATLGYLADLTSIPSWPGCQTYPCGNKPWPTTRNTEKTREAKQNHVLDCG
ncbi:uncharacterized protein EDB91DRAFT_1117095 [Suillus paluster]|uniref:uncharacterized protein n=1 Tax=Suillus paluster TaxID=48578 RepID=UPI001B865692|nr:uncharacterized protein EDB91DRAFT_1117095 [Suillus paluster]KAG1747229.1 hypothetical protein EDB91DRAFT_1117095 [Suillus paluster]